MTSFEEIVKELKAQKRTQQWSLSLIHAEAAKFYGQARWEEGREEGYNIGFNHGHQAAGHQILEQ